MISSEMPEIIGMSDRVVVMCQGRVTGEFSRPNLSQEEIMTSATRFLRLDAVDETGAVVAPRDSGDVDVEMAVHAANE
jgi:hypothetical protein